MWTEWHRYRKIQNYMQHPGEQPMRIIHRFLHHKTIGELFHTYSTHYIVFALHIKLNRWNDTLENEPTSAKKVSIFPQRLQEDPANQSQNCRGFEKRLTRCMSVLQLFSIHECLRRAGRCTSAWGGDSNNWWRRWQITAGGKENAQVRFL